MAGSPLIVALAVAMLIYWFRYACALVLSARIESEYVSRVIAANGLGFHEVPTELHAGTRRLDSIRRLIDRDYQLLLYLLRNARSGTDTERIEQRLLRWHYRVVGAWFWCVRLFSAAQARRALGERVRILNWLAHEVGRTLPADGTPAAHDTIMTWHQKRRSSQQFDNSIRFEAKSPRSSSARTMSSKAS